MKSPKKDWENGKLAKETLGELTGFRLKVKNYGGRIKVFKVKLK